VVQASDAGVVIWTRAVDRELQARRRRRFLAWWIGPTVVLAAVMLLIYGPGEMSGILLVSALFGGLLYGYFELRNFQRRQNLEIRLVGEELVSGKVRIPVRNVQRFTTQMTAITGFANAGGTVVSSSASAGTARFLVKLDEIREGRFTRTSHDWLDFLWPLMPEEELAGVRAAIEPHLPVAWTPPEHFRDVVEDGIGNLPPG
jgi:hypothetical protein